MDVMKPCETCFNCGVKELIDGNYSICICRLTNEEKNMWKDSCEHFKLKWFFTEEQIQEFIDGKMDICKVKQIIVNEVPKNSKTIKEKVLDFFAKK